MEDKSAIVNFLLECRYIQENEVLSSQLSQANRTIADLQEEIQTLKERNQDLETERNTLRNATRILVDHDGEQRLFRLGENQVFQEVQDEPLRNVRRRLNFDFEDLEFEVDEQDVLSRSLMEELMFGTP